VDVHAGRGLLCSAAVVRVPVHVRCHRIPIEWVFEPSTTQKMLHQAVAHWAAAIATAKT
jgi:hypothetical protein